MAGLACLLAALPLLNQDAPALQAQTSPFFSPITATPTEGPRIINMIIRPEPGVAIAGNFELWGTALIESFRRFDLHIAPTGTENWQWLTSRQDAVRNGALYLLDTTQYPDGYYDFRLRAISDYGDYTESFARSIEIRNANPPTPTPIIDVQGTPLPQPLTSTPTPTATATPDVTVRQPGGQGFYAPEPGATVRGYTAIVGTVNGLPRQKFARYELYISPTGAEDWTWLYSDTQQFWQDDIYLFDTRRVPDGHYDLRLRIVYQDGNYDEYFLRRLTVANRSASAEPAPQALEFIRPHPSDLLAGAVEFWGTAISPDFARWELSWSTSGAEQWAFLVSSERPTLSSRLATLDLSPLPLGRYDFRLRMVYRNGNYQDTFLRGMHLVSLSDLPTSTPTLTPEPTPTPTSTAAG